MYIKLNENTVFEFDDIKELARSYKNLYKELENLKKEIDCKESTIHNFEIIIEDLNNKIKKQKDVNTTLNIELQNKRSSNRKPTPDYKEAYETLKNYLIEVETARVDNLRAVINTINI